MVSKTALLALALGVSVAFAPRARAFVAYTANNPAANFTLFTYDSPGFITTDTVVPVADLAYFAPPPLNFISSVLKLSWNALGCRELRSGDGAIVTR